MPLKHFEYFLNEEKIHLEKMEREERKRKERKQRKRMDYFKHYLKELYPPLTKDSTWEKVKSIVRHSEEYQDLDESQRVEVFDKVIQRLKEKAEQSEEEERRRRKKDRRRRRSRSDSREDYRRKRVIRKMTHEIAF